MISLGPRHRTSGARRAWAPTTCGEANGQVGAAPLAHDDSTGAPQASEPAQLQVMLKRFQWLSKTAYVRKKSGEINQTKPEHGGVS